MAGARMGGALRQIHHLFVEGTVAGLADGQLLERFLEGGDGAAFAALVERYGPMVLRTCRAVLHRPEDVEDAFQATFLVLVCKARSIRGRGALVSWLRQVAHRVAVRAGAESARRRECERAAGAGRASNPHRNEPDDDWRVVLHEELARLSDRYRLPVLLCDLEGKTHAQAAAELGCGPATLQRRLGRARALLRSRLSGRGVTLTAGAVAATLGRPAVAQIPPGWIQATVATARPFASRPARLAIGQVVATSAENLARQCIRGASFGWLRAVAALFVAMAAIGGIAWGVAAPAPDDPGAVRSTPNSPRSQAMMPAEAGKPTAGREVVIPGIFTFRGRVVDPSGRPFAGATIHLAGRAVEPSAAQTIRATSGPDGRFRFDVPGEAFAVRPGNSPRNSLNIVARAPGYAFGLADDDDRFRDCTLTLARDDAPVDGRIVDLEGRPVAGAAVKVVEVRLPIDPSFARGVFTAVKVLNAVRPATDLYGRSIRSALDTELNSAQKDLDDNKEWATLESPFLPNHAGSEAAPAFIPDATTGPDGRFRIVGLGRGRIATLEVAGPTIETTSFEVRTWPGAPIHIPAPRNPRSYVPWTVYGATFEHVAGPTRAIEGIVRDRETGRPLADIMVYSNRSATRRGAAVRTITDAQGRFRLVGLPLGREGNLVAVPACDLSAGANWFELPRLPADRCPPYFQAEVPVGNRPGKELVHLDITLNRGVRVTGRITDKDTGKPVRGRVGYFVFDDNPHRKDDPDPDRRRGIVFTDEDGTFRLVVYPGPGLLAAYAFGPYFRSAGVEAIQKRRADWVSHISNGRRLAGQFHALQWIEPAAGASSITADLFVEPAARRP